MEKLHWNVLVFPGGMENGLEILASLKHCKEVTLFSASSDTPNQAFYTYQNNNICRDVRLPGWVCDLNNIITKHNIDVIFPANSFIIDALNSNRENICCPILLPSDSVLKITRSKRKTLSVLRKSLPCPVIYRTPAEIRNFPVFAKPDNGYGAQGTVIIKNAEDLNDLDLESYVIQEFLPGKEFTIDCFSDSSSNLLFVSGRERSRIRMATSMHAEPVAKDLDIFFRECAEKILQKIKLTGAWFFQMKEDISGNLKLLEIDARIAGTMCYDRCKGVNFPLLSLYTFFGHPVKIMTNSFDMSMDRCLRNRFLINYDYDAVYVDLDDTIIFKNKINTLLITFLFQCLNNNKEIILLSKHLGNGDAFLREYRIYDIFSSIIWLKEEDEKYKYIKNRKSIYIDDSFSQREKVFSNLGIPTFDSSMIECLIDERI